MGWYGSAFPYVPTVSAKMYLPLESTQTSAYIYGEAWTIPITDKKSFIASFRRILDPKASLTVDNALLAIGPSEFGEKPS